MYHEDVSDAAKLSFSDVRPEIGEALVRKFPKHSAVSFSNPLTYAGYKDVPVSYLICEKDKVIPPSKQREEITMIEMESKRKVDVVTIEAGHCPMVNAGKEVVAWILELARGSG